MIGVRGKFYSIWEAKDLGSRLTSQKSAISILSSAIL